jgi:methyl-accepting chemotaxis protein
MDEVTQQNSALVEENAATAKTLETQAGAMDQRVGVFRLDESATVHTPRLAAPAPRAPAAALKRPAPAKAAPKRAASGGPVGRMQTALATAVRADADWKEF